MKKYQVQIRSIKNDFYIALNIEADGGGDATAKAYRKLAFEHNVPKDFLDNLYVTCVHEIQK